MKQTIEDIILQQRNVGKAIRMLRKRVGELNIGEGTEMLDAVAGEYSLMCNVVAKGMSDPRGREIYEGMLRRVFMAYNNIRLCSIVRHRPTFAQCKRDAMRMSGWHDTVLEVLERYVQDVAMASLLQADERERVLKKLRLAHQKDMDVLFCSLLVSRQWTEEERRSYVGLLLSPTIDQNDAMLVVSAITMSLLTVFDVNKWLALVAVYEGSGVVQIRQRALVGFALSMPGKELGLYNVGSMMERVFATTPLAKDLLELQMQMVYCAKTEEDNAAIQHDIMPAFKNRFAGGLYGGRAEPNDKTLDGILDEGSGGRMMAEMEEKMARVRDMQSKGVDIYFGGFAKMKGFAFFYRISNWFVPFSADHPDVADVFNADGGKGVFRLLGEGAFCDSDKYSLVFALASVYDKMPQNVRETLLSGKNPKEGGAATADTESATYVRRVYLQNLYRFFSLHSGRKDFRNPFAGILGGKAEDKSFFVMNPIFRTRISGVASSLVRFFFKQHQYAMLETFVECRITDGAVSFDERCLLGYSYMRTGRYDCAADIFRVLYGESQQNVACLKGLARSLFVQKRYLEAGDLFGRLLETDKDNVGYIVSRSVAFINSGKPKEGMADLFRADFECPGNADIKRAIIWGYLVEAKPADAERVCSALQRLVKLEGSDLLNTGYAKWFQAEIHDAVDLFSEYVKSSLGGDVERLAADFNTDSAVLDANGVEDFARNVMIDLVLQNMS